MQLSVVILNYKVPYYLLLCLESVTKSLKDLDAEIIVVDNHSEDESCQLVEKHFPEVKLIANKENGGFSKGNNQGVSKAKGELICLLNPDTVVGERTFQNLIAFSEKHENFGIIGPKLIDGRGNFLPESKRNIPTPKVALKKMLNSTKGYYSGLNKDKNGKVGILVGAFMLMKKNRYLKVGGLDEDYFMYGEDIDLSYKFLKAGFQNYYVGSETVLHFKGESTAKDGKYRKRFYGAMRIFYQKHFQKNSASRLFVDLGLQLAKVSHSLRMKESPTLTSPEKYIWVGDKNESFQKLKNGLTSEVKILSPESLKTGKLRKSIVVFDAEKMSFQEIFKLMQNLNENGNCFRLKPKRFDFILGSDQSTGKGEVSPLTPKGGI